MKANNQFKIYFDGGTIGANGSCRDGYGSWEVLWNGFSKGENRKVFTPESIKLNCKIDSVSCNTAEWMALIGALEWLQSVRTSRAESDLLISGDSKLILNQLEGVYKTKQKHLKELKERAYGLLSGWRSFETYWKPRKHSVARFGH